MDGVVTTRSGAPSQSNRIVLCCGLTDVNMNMIVTLKFSSQGEERFETRMVFGLAQDQSKGCNILLS